MLRQISNQNRHIKSVLLTHPTAFQFFQPLFRASLRRFILNVFFQCVSMLYSLRIRPELLVCYPFWLPYFCSENSKEAIVATPQ
jgi:hypothetical protein